MVAASSNRTNPVGQCRSPDTPGTVSVDKRIETNQHKALSLPNSQACSKGTELTVTVVLGLSRRIENAFTN